MKEEVIRFRVTEAEKQEVVQAAESKHQTMSEYLYDKVFNTEEGGRRVVKPLTINMINYQGLIFKFNLEVIDDEIVIVPHIYKGKQEIKFSDKTIVIARTAEDIEVIQNKWGAVLYVQQWMKNWDNTGANPFRRFMEDDTAN